MMLIFSCNSSHPNEDCESYALIKMDILFLLLVFFITVMPRCTTQIAWSALFLLVQEGATPAREGRQAQPQKWQTLTNWLNYSIKNSMTNYRAE